ncbi:MAG: hypothetical protein J6L69_07975 [Lachnospiraceae bacterium]|nr:hypothetical protein [Lachnospiraceae bacterium]
MELIGYLIIVAVLVVFFAVNSVRYSREKEQQLMKRIKNSYGKRCEKDYKPGEFEKIRHYFEYLVENGILEDYIDEITWNDVDMDRVFKQMNNTYSSVGEEYLYFMLRKGKNSKEELVEFDRLVKVFENNETIREKVARIYADMGKTKSISIFDFIHRLGDLGKRSNLKHYLMAGALLASFVALLIEPAIGVLFLITFVVINVIQYYRTKAEIDNYVICFSYLVRLIVDGKNLAKLSVPEFEQYNKRLVELTKDLKNIEKGIFLLPSNSVKESIGEMIMEYIRMLFHVDLIKFNSMLKHTLDRLSVVDELFEIMGKIESAYAVASYRNMLENEYGFYAIPDFSGDELIIEEGYHPLIVNPVKNSISTDKSVLLTGSNASGKSTFLKTVSINAILSQTIYTSVSRKYVAKMYSVFSSMALKDNLSENESYYIVEIKSLKRIIDRVKVDKNVICFVDEVLRGTNTVERIAASSEILKHLATNGVMCFAATHDIELTHILEGYYANYHFEETVENDDVLFNYKLNEGRARTRNAIKLLKIMGFDDSIIEAANGKSEYFLEKGVWN